MRKINPDHAKRLVETINSSPYFQLLSMRIRDLGVGYSVAEVDVSKKHLNPFDVVHGGAVFIYYRFGSFLGTVLWN